MGPKWGEIEGLPSQKLFMSIFPNDFDQNLLNLKMSKMFTLLLEISRKIVFDTHNACKSFFFTKFHKFPFHHQVLQPFEDLRNILLQGYDVTGVEGKTFPVGNDLS